jgi:glyoxylase-like metal-dependent hydrolase (beta-lactamase superfamily II)
MELAENLHAFFWTAPHANNCNTYLIDGPTRILIDPGHAAHFDHVLSGLDDLGLGLSDIGLVICTHAHPDHVEAATHFRENDTPVAFHRLEWELISSMASQIRSLFGLEPEDVAPDILLEQGDLSVAGTPLEIIHSPGHSPGSISIYWPEKKALFTGDAVFKAGLGRTDLPGGNGAQLKQSIQRLAAVDCAWLLPGHGDSIAGDEKVKRNFKHLEQVWFHYI